MAIRVQTQDDINFGTAAATVTVSHLRVRNTDDSDPFIYQLPQAIQIASGAPMRIPSGLFDLVYKVGAFSNAHYLDFLQPYWTNRSMEIDLMTSAIDVVAVGGYAQQTYSYWAISQEAD